MMMLILELKKVVSKNNIKNHKINKIKQIKIINIIILSKLIFKINHKIKMIIIMMMGSNIKNSTKCILFKGKLAIFNIKKIINIINNNMKVNIKAILKHKNKE